MEREEQKAGTSAEKNEETSAAATATATATAAAAATKPVDADKAAQREKKRETLEGELADCERRLRQLKSESATSVLAQVEDSLGLQDPNTVSPLLSC